MSRNIDKFNLNKHLVEFIEKNKLLTIATVDEHSQPWICNVYYFTDGDFNFYFVSPLDTRHSKHVEHNPQVAFSVAWFDENNLGDRKAIQGQGNIVLVKDVKTILASLKIHHEKYPEWRDLINWENMKKNIIHSRLYKLTPSYIKFWNDELYGDEGVEEFTFD